MSSAPHPQGYNGGYPTNASAVDDLISSASREPDAIDEIIRKAEAGIKTSQSLPPVPHVATTPIEAALPPVVIPTPEPAEKPEVNEKKAKKDKPIRMVYSDLEFSPEEKMAQMPRYAFVPEEKAENAHVDISIMPAAVGTVEG